MKVIAFYLPQFHETPENNEWWGQGFTEWNNMKAAKPLFEGHNQPRIPLNNNYYNLLDEKTLEWQTKIAKEHGVYGFCCYHYWFGSKMLLEKPMEIYLKDKNCDLPFCFCWANETWTNAWAAETESDRKTLIKQEYGDKEEWERHFQYLLPFFKDERYIKEGNKPLFVIYRPQYITELSARLAYYNKRAQEEGFDGLVFVAQHVSFYAEKSVDKSMFKYQIEYQPGFAFYDMSSWMQKQMSVITIIAEFIVFYIAFKESNKIVKLEGIKRNLITVFWGCVIIIVVCAALNRLIQNAIIRLSASVFVSGILYGVTLILMRNEIVLELISRVKRNIIKKRIE